MAGMNYANVAELEDFIRVALLGRVGEYDVSAIAEDIGEVLSDGTVVGRVGGSAFEAIVEANRVD